jgi:hypothetical protein
MIPQQGNIELGNPVTGLGGLLDLDQVISNIQVSFEFLEKLEYSTDT